MQPRTADVVVVGGGTVGAWCATFLASAGAGRVVLIDADRLGAGASPRAAGMVRAQGGTPTAVRLGMWTRDFYRGQRDAYPIDSGFVAQGYYMPAFSEDEERVGRARVAMQQGLGLDVEWLEPSDVDAGNPAMTPGLTHGASYSPTDGYIDPPKNVLAYTAALVAAGVTICEATPFLGLETSDGAVTGVRTPAGTIATGQVVLAAGAALQEVGALLGASIWAAGARHQVVVTEAHPELAPERLPMVFDLPSGIYWRPEEGGVLWGMSNPDEAPGPALRFDDAYFQKMKSRMDHLLPATARVGIRRSWAATIDFTPDHLPILGPVVTADGPLAGTTIASAAGHGMMWGPGVARTAADLVLHGRSEVVDTTELGLDRFDSEGRSRLDPDPIALPFPERTTR